MKEHLSEKWYRAVDTFYLFFGTEEYLKSREPYLLFDVWVCKSVEWKTFRTHKEAVAALKEIGKSSV